MQGKRALGAGSAGANAEGQVLPAWAGVCSGVRVSGDHSWGAGAVLSERQGLKYAGSWERSPDVGLGHRGVRSNKVVMGRVVHLGWDQHRAAFPSLALPEWEQSRERLGAHRWDGCAFHFPACVR